MGIIRCSSTKDNSKFPRVMILSSEYTYVRRKNKVKKQSMAKSTSVENSQTQICIDLNYKWSIYDNTHSITRLLQLSFS